MRITDAFVQTGAIREVQKAVGAKTDKKTEEALKPNRAQDSVSISSAARSASESDKVKTRVQALPDVRENRVTEVKARVQSGFYNTPEFRDQLADRLLKEFGANV